MLTRICQQDTTADKDAPERKARKFGLPSSASSQVNEAALFKYMADKKLCLAENITNESDSVVEKQKGRNKIYLGFARAAWRMIQTVPECFPGAKYTVVGEESKHFLVQGLKISGEDIHRFMCLWRYILQCRRNHTSKKSANQSSSTAAIASKEALADEAEEQTGDGNLSDDAQTPDGERGHKPKKLEGWIKLPLFVKPGELIDNTESQEARNAAAFRNLFLAERDDEAFAPFFSSAFKATKSDLEIGEGLDAFGNAEIQLNPDLPRLSDDQKRSLLKALSRRATYLFGDCDNIDNLFAPASQTSTHNAYADLVARARDESTVDENSTSAGDAEEAKQAVAKALSAALESELNGRSSASPLWAECVEALNLTYEELDEPDDLTRQNFRIGFRGLGLLPWQPHSATWILKMIEGPLRFGLLSDHTGLAKTVSVLTATLVRAERTRQAIDAYDKKREALSDELTKNESMPLSPEEVEARIVAKLGAKPKHKPVLILVPPNARGAWENDINKFFNDRDQQRKIILKSFMGDNATDYEKSIALESTSAKGMQDYCQSLSTTDMETSQTCIITTLQIYARACLKKADRAASKVVDVADSYELMMADDLFSLLVVDEGHALKDEAAKQSIAVYKTDAPYVVCSATPFINSVRDICGLLRFPWKAAKTMLSEGPPTHHVYNHKGFADGAEEFDARHGRSIFNMQPSTQRQFFPALEPALVKKRLGSGDGPVDQASASKVIPLPLMLISLRRVFGDKISVANHIVEIGKDIPPSKITIAELRQGRVEAGLYRAIHQACFEDGTDTNLFTDDDFSTRRRRFQHATLTPLLDQVFTRHGGIDAGEVANLFQKAQDSFALFHGWTKNDYHSLPPTTRIEMVYYIVASSVKLQAVCGKLYEIVFEKMEKLIFFADWPLNLWVIELLLAALQIKFVSIRRGISNQEREAAEVAFNTDSSVKVLVASLRSAAASLNLQQGGCHIVILDVVAFNIMLQGVGRVRRFGQKHPQTITILVVDETHDQYLLWKHLENYRSELRGTSQLDIPDLAAGDEETTLEWLLNRRDQKVTLVQYVHEQLGAAAVNGMVQCVFGVRSNLTTSWKNVRNPRAKNLDPEQRLFRLAYGGDVANEVLQQMLDARIAKARAQSVREEGQQGEQTDDADDEGQTDGYVERTPSARAKKVAPFAQALLPRSQTSNFEGTTHVAEIIRAAREMAKPCEYRLRNVTAQACVYAARKAVSKPSPYVDEALDRFDDPKVDRKCIEALVKHHLAQEAEEAARAKDHEVTNAKQTVIPLRPSSAQNSQADKAPVSVDANMDARGEGSPGAADAAFNAKQESLMSEGRNRLSAIFRELKLSFAVRIKKPTKSQYTSRIMQDWDEKGRPEPFPPRKGASKEKASADDNEDEANAAEEEE